MAFLTSSETGERQLTRILPHMPNDSSDNLITTRSMVRRTSYVERAMDLEPPLPARQRSGTMK